MKRIVFTLFLSLVLGAVLGVISKYLDTVGIDGSSLSVILRHLADVFTRLGIWVFIATILAAYSPTWIQAAGRTLLFFAGMLVSYYIYSAYLFGFFSFSYFYFWGAIACVSPFLGAVVWFARKKHFLQPLLAALPMGLMLYLAFAIGYYYIDLSYIEELAMFILLTALFFISHRNN